MEEHDRHLHELRTKSEPIHPREIHRQSLIEEIIDIQNAIKPYFPTLHINTPEELEGYSIGSLLDYRTHLRKVEVKTEVISAVSDSSSEPQPRCLFRDWVPFILGALSTAVVLLGWLILV